MKKRLLGALMSVMSVALIGGFAAQALSPTTAYADARQVKVAEYTFADGADLGKDTSENGNHLTAIGSLSQDTTIGGARFDGSSVLYAAGSGDDKKGYDFADALVEEDFTMTVDFYVDSSMATDDVKNTRVYRSSIVTLWGHMYTDNFDNNIGGAANNRAAALTVDSVSTDKKANLRFAWADGGSPDWGELVTVTADAWHTFTFSWDPIAKKATGTMDSAAYFQKTAMAGYGFSSNVARFTLGGYYTDPLNGGRGITASDGKINAFVGNIKNVLITKTVMDGNKYNALASYDFKDSADIGKTENSAYALTEWGSGAAYDTEKGALYSPVGSVLVPKGFDKTGYDGHDFMDYLAGSDFTVSTTFMLPKDFADGQKADGRGVIFSLWGLWNGQSYGGTAEANLVSSSVIYDAYDAGAEEANIRIGFLYPSGGTNDDGSVKTENGWWSNKETKLTTDVFHTLSLSMKGLTCTVYVDGAAFVTFDCYEGNAWGRVETAFALGGAAGTGGISGGGCVYFKNFAVYDFAMKGAEMASLYQEKLEGVDAPYIVSAAEVDSAVTIHYNAEDEEILAAAPAASDVEVTLSDETKVAAKAIWTSVERKGAEVFLKGVICGAKASNISGVLASMPVVLETIEETPAFISYAFDDATDVGKSNLGGMYDLVKQGDGTAVATDGYLALDNASLSAQADAYDYDYMDYMKNFTMEIEFRLPQGVEQSHTPLIAVYNNGGVKANSAVIMLNNYGVNDVGTTLRVGFAYESTSSSDGGGEDGYANAAYWSQYNATVSLGVWNKLAFSYNAEERTLTAYVNGTKVCRYAVAPAAVFAGDFCLSLGDNGRKLDLKSFKIYDYLPSEADLTILSKAGVMPQGAETAVVADKILSAKGVTVKAETASLDAATALKLTQEAQKTVRTTAGENELKLNVLWDKAEASEDGTYLVTGLILGGYNPDGVRAEAVVSVQEYAVSFTGANAVVKVNGDETTTANVKYGAAISFTVEAADGYTISAVKVGETVLTAVDGVYTIENVTAAVAVTVETTKNPVVPPVSSESQSESVPSSSESEAPSSSESTSASSNASDSAGGSTSGQTSGGNSTETGCGSAMACGILAVVAIFGGLLLIKGRKKQD